MPEDPVLRWILKPVIPAPLCCHESDSCELETELAVRAVGAATGCCCPRQLEFWLTWAPIWSREKGQNENPVPMEGFMIVLPQSLWPGFAELT